MHIDIYISECMLSAYFNRLQPWSEVWDAIAELAEIVGDAAPHGVSWTRPWIWNMLCSWKQQLGLGTNSWKHVMIWKHVIQQLGVSAIGVPLEYHWSTKMCQDVPRCAKMCQDVPRGKESNQPRLCDTLNPAA